MTNKRKREILHDLGPVEILHPVESMPLNEAVYCVNCGMVTRSIDSAKACAVCGDRTALPSLARALYREGEAVA